MQELIKSIFAGIMIGIAGLIYLNVEIPIVGAVLFSVGLIVIVLCNYNLYTGKIGYIKSCKEIKNMIIYIIGNAIGAFLISFSHSNNINAEQLVISKLSIPYFIVLIKSIWCGFLMYISVNVWKEHKKLIGIIVCIPAFILCGFEHSIADMFYVFSSRIININSITFLIITIIGNAIGANLHKLIRKEKKKNETLHYSS